MNPCFVFASFCSVVRSYSSGGFSTFSFFSTLVTVAHIFAFTLLYDAAASSLSCHFFTEENFTTVSVPAGVTEKCSWCTGSGVKRLFSQYLLQTIPSVGVCTRPTEYVPRPAATVSACVPLMPTSQSASLRAFAARYRSSYSCPSFSSFNPLRMAVSVSELIHRRRNGSVQPV